MQCADVCNAMHKRNSKKLIILNVTGKVKRESAIFASHLIHNMQDKVKYKMPAWGCKCRGSLLLKMSYNLLDLKMHHFIKHSY